MQFEIHLEKCKEIGVATIKENQKQQTEIAQLRGERLHFEQLANKLLKANELCKKNAEETNRKLAERAVTQIDELRNELYLRTKSKDELTRQLTVSEKTRRREKEQNIREIENLQSKLSEQEKRSDELTRKYEEVKRKIQTLQREKDHQIAEHDKNCKQLHDWIKTLMDQIEEHSKTENRLRKTMEEDKFNLMRLTNQYHENVNQVQRLHEESMSLNRDKQELLSRLSTVQDVNLTYNNPNIADLSDEKRPTKLAEDFSELYDNEWTDAFEELQYEKEDKKTAFMLDIVKKVSQVCTDFSNGHSKRIKDGFCTLTATVQTKQSKEETNSAGEQHGKNSVASEVKPERSHEEISIASDFDLLQKYQKKTIMNAKTFFESVLTNEVETTVTDLICKAFKIDKEGQDVLVSYIKKCVNICWSMCRHNPHVHLEFTEVMENVLFDTNKFKPYTRSGKYIDYIVWPPLFLHEGGPLLCKGVAQAGKLIK